MFKKTVFSTTVMFTLVTVGWVVKLLYVTEGDKIRYEACQMHAQAVAQVAQDKKSDQHRFGVRKDLWLSQADHTRLHHRIESQLSVLTLLPVGDKCDVVEELHNFQCWMQDKLYVRDNVDMQQVRFFAASRGTYQYSMQRFAASVANLSLFRLPGTTLPGKVDADRPFLRGVARNISFSVAGVSKQFHAEQFQATLLPQQGEKL